MLKPVLSSPHRLSTSEGIRTGNATYFCLKNVMWIIIYIYIHMYIYMSVQKVSSHVVWKIETFIEENTRNIAHRTVTPQPLSQQAPWGLTQLSQSPSAALLYFPAPRRWSEIHSLSKGILVLEKASSFKAPNQSCRGAESPGCFDVLQKKKTPHETWCRSGHTVAMKPLITRCP